MELPTQGSLLVIAMHVAKIPTVWLVPIMLPTAWEVACFLTLLPVQCVIKLFFFLTLILDISKHIQNRKIARVLITQVQRL